MASATRNEDSKDERLKAALWYSIGEIVDSIAIVQDFNATPHFIGGLSEMIWGQIELLAGDLEAYAKHAGRSTINCKDVLLLTRRNDALREILEAQANTAQRDHAHGR